MLYTYTIYSDSGTEEEPIRCEVTTRIEEIKPTDVCHPRYVEVYHNGTNNIVKDLRSLDDLEGWIVGLERAFAWKPEKQEVKKDAINPSHYQGYVMDLQWLETMQYLPNFRDPKNFKAAVELQIRKYLDRLGGKDAELQELEKALWYTKFLVAYTKNKGPIRVKDIENILKG